MDRLTEITKAAFLAKFNECRNRTAVDAQYRTINGSSKLIIVFEDGSEEIFTGFPKAA